MKKREAEFHSGRAENDKENSGPARKKRKHEKTNKKTELLTSRKKKKETEIRKGQRKQNVSSCSLILYPE